MNDPSNVLESMEDIDGLLPISGFQLSPVDILLCLILLSIAIFLTYLFYRRYKYKKTDCFLLEMEFNTLLKNYKNISANSFIDNYIILMKKTCLLTHNREEFACLSGDNYLQWLKDNDPHKFNWNKYSKILSKMAYIKNENVKISKSEVQEMIARGKLWLKK